MRRRQRRFHALIWPVLGGLIAAVIVAGVLMRTPLLTADYSASERSGP